MDKLESQSLKEAAWRSRLLRHAQSGKSIAAFCRDESVSTGQLSYLAGQAGRSDVLQRVSQHPASLVHELTLRIWKEVFALNPLRSDLSDRAGQCARAAT
jgi:hypothetical protein